MLEKLTPCRVLRWNQSDYATALGAVERPKNKARKPPGITRRRIREMIADGESNQAFDVVSKALANYPGEEVFELWVQLAAIVRESSRILRRAREIHRHRNADFWSTSALAVALASLNRRDEAKSILGPETSDDDNSFPLAMARLSILSEEKDGDEYLVLLDRLLALKPSNPLLLTYKAEVSEDLGECMKLVDQALTIDEHCLSAIFLRTTMRLRTALKDPHGFADALRADLQMVDRFARDHCLTRCLHFLYRFELQDFHAAQRELDLAIQDPRLMADREAMSLMFVFRSEINRALNDIDRCAPRLAGGCTLVAQRYPDPEGPGQASQR